MSERITTRPAVSDERARAAEFLDHLHVIACLLHPFNDAAGNHAFFGYDKSDEDLTDEGWRILSHVALAIEDALKAERHLGEYPAEVMMVLVPMRWTVAQLSRAYHRGESLPENAADILDQCFYQVRDATLRFADKLGYVGPPDQAA